MKVSFTGTRRGMTVLQRRALRTELSALFSPVSNTGHLFIHGDCIGADEQAHKMVRRYFPWVSIATRPSNHHEMRAECEADVMHAPCDPLIRNVSIVREGSVLLACPAENEEQRRGGTWFTVRKARAMGKRIVLIRPDGTIKEENA